MAVCLRVLHVSPPPPIVILERAVGEVIESDRRKNAKMNYYVYIMTNIHNTVLYTGITNNLARRIYEHKNELLDGFTKKYKIKN